jgi:hypothetical protein
VQQGLEPLGCHDSIMPNDCGALTIPPVP